MVQLSKGKGAIEMVIPIYINRLEDIPEKKYGQSVCIIRDYKENTI